MATSTTQATETAPRHKTEKQSALWITDPNGQRIRVPHGQWYMNTKTRNRALWRLDLTPEASRVYAVLEAGTMGFRQELAVVMEKGETRPMTPTDVNERTGMLRQSVRRAMDELERAGLAERRSTDGGGLRKGHVLLYSWAAPRAAETPQIEQRAGHNPTQLPPEWKALERLAKRLKLDYSQVDIEAARTLKNEGEELARELESIERRAARFLESLGARGIPERFNKEESNGKKGVERNEEKNVSAAAFSDPVAQAEAARHAAAAAPFAEGLKPESFAVPEPHRDEATVRRALVDASAAAGHYEQPDEATVRHVIRNARSHHPAATARQIAAGIAKLASNQRRSGFGLYLTHLIPADVPEAAPAPAAAMETPPPASDEQLAEWRATIADPQSSELEREIARQQLEDEQQRRQQSSRAAGQG